MAGEDTVVGFWRGSVMVGEDTVVGFWRGLVMAGFSRIRTVAAYDCFCFSQNQSFP